MKEGKALNIPGAGQTAKISANGRDGFFSGMCKYITRDDAGYVLTWVGGQNAGTYHVPFERVDHVKWDITPEEAELFHNPKFTIAGVDMGAPGGDHTVQHIVSGKAMSAAAKFEAVMELLKGIPSYDEDGKEIGRSAPLITAEQAREALGFPGLYDEPKTGSAKTTTKPQKSVKPAKA